MNENGSKQSFIDKINGLVNKNDQAPKPFDPSSLQNVRTQSMVISGREEAEQELKRLELERQQQARDNFVEAATDNAKKTSVYVIITTICLILVVLIAVLVFTMIPFFRRPSGGDININHGDDDTTKIGFYECLSRDCVEIATLNDGRTLVHDGNYVILDKENEQSFTTALYGNYVSAESFDWGEVNYLLVKQESGTGSIFSVTNNRYVNSSENYEEVFADINDEKYNEQRWVEGKYLIVKRSGDYRLLDMESGKEVVQGTTAVFATKEGFYVAYDQDGKKRVFNNSNNQVALIEGGKAFVRDGYLVIVYDGGNFQVVDQNGENPQEYSFQEELNNIEQAQRQSVLTSSSSYANIPN